VNLTGVPRGTSRGAPSPVARHAVQLAVNALHELVFHRDQRRLVILHAQQGKILDRFETVIGSGLAKRIPRLALAREIGNDVTLEQVEEDN
jgi:hypothetical protein